MIETVEPRALTAAAAQGVVYTRPWVVRFILDLAGYLPERDLVRSVVVEPSIGDGAFLVQLVERLVESARRHGHSLDECRHSIVAFEIDAAAAGRARQATLDALAELSVDVDLAIDLVDQWITVDNYLLANGDRENSPSLFDEPLCEHAGVSGVDFVIGNPPYIRLEDIPTGDNLRYRALFPTMRGRADIYVAFFEAALRRLRPDGVCAFICADRWMYNQYGAELRRLVTSGFNVDAIIDMNGVDAFETEVSAYPAITVIRNGPRRRTVVAAINVDAGESFVASLPSSIQSLVDNEDDVVINSAIKAYRASEWFAPGEPWIRTTPDRFEMLRRLERSFMPLEHYGARVGIGVATGADAVFIVEDRDIAEEDRMLPLAMTGDIKTGCLDWSGHYLANPWTEHGLIDLRDYPRLSDYFASHATVLRQRNVARRSHHAWYRTIDRVYPHLLEQPKLFVPDIKESLFPVLDEGTVYPHHNLYYIVSDQWDLEVLGALLISGVGRFFVEHYGVRMRGGYLRMQAQYLRRIRVPDPDSLSSSVMDGLRQAFRARDVGAATAIACEAYDIPQIP